MNITEFAMLKKMLGKGGGGGNGGLVDVDRIDYQIEGVENCVYRLTAGFYFCGGSNSYAKKGKTYLVDKLPEVGEPFVSLESGEINAVYYNTSDNVLYVYVSDELGAVAETPAGWYEYNELGGGFKGTVTNCISMESDLYYLLLNTVYFIYKDGKWVELGNIRNAVSYTNCKVNFWDDEGNAAYIPITVSYKTYENGKLKNVSKQLEGNSETEILAVQGTEMFIDKKFNYWVNDARLSGLSIRYADDGLYIIVPYLEDCYITISS